jgi:hypothetical protein
MLGDGGARWPARQTSQSLQDLSFAIARMFRLQTVTDHKNNYSTEVTKMQLGGAALECLLGSRFPKPLFSTLNVNITHKKTPLIEWRFF